MAGIRDLDEFPAWVVEVLGQLVPCGHAGYDVIDLPSRTASVADLVDVLIDGGQQTLAAFADQSPVIVRAGRATDRRDGRASST